LSRAVQTELRRYRQEAKEAARPPPTEIGGDLSDDDLTAAAAAATTTATAAAELDTLDESMFDFDEDEEAMLAELENGAPVAPRPAAPPPPPPAAKAPVREEEEDYDAMEAEALREAQEEFNVDEVSLKPGVLASGVRHMGSRLLFRRMRRRCFARWKT
jgi:hypothetical protein